MALSFFVWFWDAIYRDRWKVVQQCWIRFHSFTNIVGATHAHNTMHCRSQHCWELIVASVCTPLPTWMQQLPTLLAQHCWELIVASVCTPLPTRMQQLPTLLAQHCWELIIASVCTPLPTRMQQLPTLLAAQFCELMRPFARSLRTVESYHSKIKNLAMFILNRITFAPAQKPYRKRFIFTHHGTVISARFLLR